MILHQAKKVLVTKMKDNAGVPPLKDGENICTDAKHKAHVLNNQFESVFTTEDLPQLDQFVHPSIQDISFSIHGIQLLLERLDPSKAPGPDHLPTKVIKLCAVQISPVLQIIYSQSLEHAALPQDCMVVSQHHAPLSSRKVIEAVQQIIDQSP